MLRAGGTRMIGQNAEAGAYGEVLGYIKIWFVRSRKNAVFLVGSAQDVTIQCPAVFGACQAESKVVFLPLCPAVAAHCHPARIHNGPSFFFLVADDGGEHAQCNIGFGADANVVQSFPKSEIMNLCVSHLKAEVSDLPQRFFGV